MNNFESNTTPSVSCVLPFYNAEKYLHATLSSISGIDYPKIELILINDGSTDQSLDIVKKFLNNSILKENHKIINNSGNHGISYSKNIGLKNCTGEYFFFAGADDIQNCERISKPLDYLQKNPSIDIVYFDCTICSSTQSFKQKRKFPRGMNQENSILYQLKRNHFWSGLLLAKNTINQKFDENLTNAVDYDWYFNLFFNNKKISFIRDSLLDYNTHENNISKNLLSSLNNVQKIFSKYDFTKLKKKLLLNFDSHQVNLSYAWIQVTLGNYKEAIKFLIKIDIETNFFEITFLLGSSYAKTKQYNCAIECFSKIYKAYPESVECINNLAVTKFQHNSINIDKSVTLLKTALDINPRYSDAYANLTSLENGSYSSLIITTKPLRETLIHS